MKKKIFLITSIVLFVVVSSMFFHSCNSDEIDSYFTDDQQSQLDKFAFVGEEHNIDMNNIYEQLKLRTNLKGSSKLVLTKDNAIAMVKSSAINIIGDEAYSFDDGVKSIIDESFSVKRLRLKNTNKETLVDSIISHSELSSSFRQLYKELISISDKYKLSVEQQKREIDKLTYNAFNLLNGNELDYFLIGASVSVASFEYWHTNICKWVELFGVTNNKVRLKNGSEFWEPGGGLYDGMTGADVGGAVTGAITGAAVGAAPGAALGGVAGAVGASTGKVIDNIGEYFGWW